MPDFEVIAESKRYILAEDEADYGIWDIRAGDDAIDRFPHTDEGFELAWRRFTELKHADSDLVGKSLAGLIGFGLVLWLAGGTYGTVAFLLPFEEPLGTFLQVAAILDAVGFRLGVGGLLVLVTVVLLRREKRATNGSAARPPNGDALIPRARADRILWSVLVVGLVTWVVAEAVASTYNPTFSIPLASEPPRPTDLQRVAFVVGTIARNAWVASVVLIGLRLLFRWRRGTIEA